MVKQTAFNQPFIPYPQDELTVLITGQVTQFIDTNSRIGRRFFQIQIALFPNWDFFNRQLSSIHRKQPGRGRLGNEVRQRASKNLADNPCLAIGLLFTFSFISLLLWLSERGKARSYGLFSGNRLDNGIATKSATGWIFRREAPSVP